MDEKLTAKIQEWLATPAEQRDMVAGATMMLQLNRNRILYQNAIRRPDKFADKVEYELNKFLAMRLANVTTNDVVKLEQKVQKEIVPMIERSFTTAANGELQFVGKRADHDSLPDEIQAIYVEQATIAHQMRDLHAKLRLKSGPEYLPCDRYQDLDLLVETAKTYLANWEKYDNYGKEAEVATAAATTTTKKKAKSKKKA